MTRSLTTHLLKPMLKYPHMLPEDTNLWTRYLNTEPFQNAEVAYDVHVGTPTTPQPGTPPNYVHMIERLSTLRIDVVVFLPNETIIFEVKPRASLTAIGQALSYAHLYHRDFPRHPNPHPTVLTDTALPDTPWLCNRLQVLLIELD